jgi:hypothetical protein
MSKEVKQALQIAIDYMNERLEDHDCKYQRHPATEAERINILADIETVKEALAKQEGQSNFCPQCEALARELKAAKQEQGEPVANASTWFALVMNAAAELENASIFLRDEDAKRVAISGAKYYRDQANTLYTTPYVPTGRQQRTAAEGKDTRRAWVKPHEWRGLTDGEVAEIYMSNTDKPLPAKWDFARAIEVKLRSKNT